MKRLLTTALASVILAGSIAGPALAAPQPPQHHDDHDRGQPHGDHGDWHQGNNEWREDRRDARWDEHKYNGYWVGKAWHAGPPPESAYRLRGFQLGWRPWHKGDRLGAYHTHYVEVTDWRGRRLKAPPRGYHYVETDTGDIILAAVATGLIASIIAHH